MLLFFSLLLMSLLGGLLILGLCGGNILPLKELELPCPLLHSFVFLPYLPALTCIPQLTACAFNSRVLVICLLVGFLFCILGDQNSRKIDVKLSPKTKTIMQCLLFIINQIIWTKMVKRVFRLSIWNKSHSLLSDFSNKHMCFRI